MNLSVHRPVQESRPPLLVSPSVSGRTSRNTPNIRHHSNPHVRTQTAPSPAAGHAGDGARVQRAFVPRWLGVALFLLGLCLGSPAAAETDIPVVTSIKPVHSLASAVMDGVGEPHLLMRGAGSPHEFKLRPSDAAMLEEAAVIFLIDERMEATLVRPIGTLARDARVVALTQAKGLVRRPLREGGAFEEDHNHQHDEPGDHEGDQDDVHEHEHEHDHGDDHSHHEDDHDSAAFDLHVWLDPVNAWAMARMMAEVLSEADPANAAVYQENVQELLHRLDDLTEEIDEQVAPVRGQPFIVFHDAYRYFEDRFGLTAMGSAVVSEERSPGVRRIRELREKVRQLGVTCVFSEPHFDQRLVATIIEGTAIRSGTVDGLGVDVENGPELYFTMLGNLAASFSGCLTPADGE